MANTHCAVLFQFNFVGKLLGPRGSSLQALQASSQTRMAVLGRGSVRGAGREAELRAAGDPRHAHLALPLHVEGSRHKQPMLKRHCKDTVGFIKHNFFSLISRLTARN